MTQGERVRMIRKHPNVNLTLEKFGEKLGIKKSALSLIENGKNNLTEQMAKSICREFRVNYSLKVFLVFTRRIAGYLTSENGKKDRKKAQR